MLERLLDLLSLIGIERLDRRSIDQRKAEAEQYAAGREQGRLDVIEYGTGDDSSRDYLSGLCTGAAAERERVRWLGDHCAMEALGWVDRGDLADADPDRSESPLCKYRESIGKCWGCCCLTDCWRLRPGVRVGVVIEEGE